MMCRNMQQMQNPLMMRLPLRGRCFSPVTPVTEPLGHGDFGGPGSTLFPRNHLSKPADVSCAACSFSLVNAIKQVCWLVGWFVNIFH